MVPTSPLAVHTPPRTGSNATGADDALTRLSGGTMSGGCASSGPPAADPASIAGAGYAGKLSLHAAANEASPRDRAATVVSGPTRMARPASPGTPRLASTQPRAPPSQPGL